jgi:hypothetical protein
VDLVHDRRRYQYEPNPRSYQRLRVPARAAAESEEGTTEPLTAQSEAETGTSTPPETPESGIPETDASPPPPPTDQ